MRGCFAADARRAFVSPRMTLAILMCAALYLLGTVSEIGSTDPLYLLDSAMNVGAFSYLLPLVAAIIMPLSTITIVGFVTFMSNYLSNSRLK